MSLYDLTVPQLIKCLRNVDHWLEAAIKHAEHKKFDVNNLIKVRLAPDQFAFDRQVQSVCDNTKFIVGRLTGKEWPAQADTETTFDELRARVATASAYLATFKARGLRGRRGAQDLPPAVDGGQVDDRHGVRRRVRARELLLPPDARVRAAPSQRRRARQARDFIGGVPMRA